MTPDEKQKAQMRDREVLEHILNEDVSEALKTVEKDNSQRSKRNAVRAVFAYIEGLTYTMRSNALLEFDLGPLKYTPAELAFLREETYTVDEQGRIHTGRRRLDLKRQVLFSFAMFARHFDPAYVLDCSGDDWRTFCAALEIRHRITHPKSGSELDISDEEFQKVIRPAFVWFFLNTQDVYGRSIDAIQQRINSLSEKAPGI